MSRAKPGTNCNANIHAQELHSFWAFSLLWIPNSTPGVEAGVSYQRQEVDN